MTNYVRKPPEMEGGTTFCFVTDGIETTLARARASVFVGGGEKLLEAG